MPYFGLIVLVIWIAALVDVVVADENEVRHLPKIVWLIFVVLIPLAGSIVWFIAGRPLGGSRPVRQHTAGFPEYERPQPSASSSPEDEEAFRRKFRERAEEQRRKGRELRGEDTPPAAD